jgi:hypothetical protein
MPAFRRSLGDRSPRLRYRETNVRKINALKHVRPALTCTGPVCRFRAEFRPPPKFAKRRIEER